MILNIVKHIPSTTIQQIKKIFWKRVYAKIKVFKPHKKMKIENKRFIVRTVENGDEFLKILKLRYKIFYKEMLNIQKEEEIDIDRYDFVCDHLIIVDKESDKIIGTYRLNSSLFSNRLYSASEFKIKTILSLLGTKLEIGRACIDKNFRNRNTILMLWKGIAEYIKTIDAKYIFGCSSINTVDINQILNITQYLNKNNFIDQSLAVQPKKKNRIKDFDKLLLYHPSDIEEDDDHEHIPPLLRFYLKIGANVSGIPALDKHFLCTDFFTFMDISKAQGPFKNKLLSK